MNKKRLIQRVRALDKRTVDPMFRQASNGMSAVG